MGIFNSLFGSNKSSSKSNKAELDEWTYEGGTYDKEALKVNAQDSKIFWIMGILLITTNKKDSSSAANNEGMKKTYKLILSQYEYFKSYLNGDKTATKADFEKFVVIWNAIDGGINFRSADKWSPHTVEQLSLTMFATYDGDKDLFFAETLPFLDKWAINFRDDEVWTWLSIKD